MKTRSVASLLVTALGCILASGCVTQEASKSEVKGQGRWVTLPPETGSMIPRRVWVDGDGNAGKTSGSGNVQVHSGSSLEQVQRNNLNSTKRPGGY